MWLRYLKQVPVTNNNKCSYLHRLCSSENYLKIGLMLASQRCFVLMQELSSLLSMEAMSFMAEDRKTPQESVSPITYTFDLFGGVDVSAVMFLCVRCQSKHGTNSDVI